MLNEADRRLIEKRKRSLRPLKTVTWLLPLIWLAIFVVTAIRYPLLVNPWELNKLIGDRALDREELASLATMSPILFLLVQMLVLAFIAGALGMFHREKRLIAMIEAENANREVTG